jgi:subtilase family serine protease
MRAKSLVASSVALLFFLLLISPAAAASTLTPNDIRGAYNVALLHQSGYTGKGVTVAVVNKGIDGTF